MAKKKKDAGILAHFGFGSSQEPDDEQNGQPDIGALQKQLADMERQLAEQREQTMNLMSYKAPTIEQFEKPEFKINLENLPDPTMEPEKYAEELAKRSHQASMEYFQAEQKATQARSKSEQTNSERIKQLWSEFSEKFEDYAEDDRRVEFAAEQAVKKAVAKGIDPERYMFGTRDRFFTDITKTMDDIFGKPTATGKEKDLDDTEDDDDEPEVRTMGVFGGMESGGKPTKGSEQQPGDMIKDMHDLQRQTGFF